MKNSSNHISIKVDLLDSKSLNLAVQKAKKFLPNRILIKKKQGLEPPIKNWLKNELKQWSLDIINNEKNYENLKIDKNRLLNLFNLHLSGKRDCHPYLWATLMTMKFNEQK